jgi:AcrR family transcriptional regulator
MTNATTEVPMTRLTPTRTARRRPTGPDTGAVRERILDAALAVLREEGVQRLTQVQVAKRAGVRQSHLTYYFPSRADLLDATAMRFVDTLAAGIGRALRGQAGAGSRTMLAHLAKAVAEPGHMRMFIGVIVEADQDPDVRAILLRGIERMEVALAEALGGEDQKERARAVLATMWGLGLYAFVVRPPGRNDPARTVLAWLEALRKESV